MNGDIERGMACTEEPEEIGLLVFDVMGVMMGVDTAQVAGMLKPEEAERKGVVAACLHERLHFREEPVRYSDPHVLVIKSEGEQRGIIIDHPREIISAKIDSIRPMPFLLASAGGSRAAWGAVLWEGQCIVLIDFYKLQEGP
ncbi:MAG: chemotaxis protein CheW [Dissulfurispiraceae bacterium]|jgi:hypothetical protein